jgi:RNase H-fold protein (predicted Holliday junction resolvase)
MTCLGLDYGTSHIGIAFSVGPLAEPLTTLPAKSALSSIKDLVVKHKVTTIIIGDADKKFLTDLASLGLPVIQVDETLSTKDARGALLHTTKIRRRKKEHSVAAAIILQSWLDSTPLNR